MNYYGEEERRKLNELLSSGAITSEGTINGIPNQTLAALMADNSEQGVQFNPTFQQGEMDRNREQFAREDVRATERGYNPQQYQTPQAPAQPAAPAAPQPQNFIQRSGGEKISLDQFAGNRPHDPFRDGPEILGRQRTPDGGEMIIKRVAGLDGFGRQTARVVQEFIPPPDMGRMKQAAEIQKLQSETAKNMRPDIDKSQIAGTIENERVLKRQDIARKGQMAEQSALDDSKKLQGFLQQAIDQTDWNSAGLIGQVMSTFGGTDATDLESVLDSIKAKIGFKELQDMRRESPTGGALGQIAVKELEFLQSVEGSLKQKQSPDQLRKNLQAILESASRLEGDLKKNPPTWDFNPGKSSGGAAPVPVNSEAEAAQLPKGTVVIINGRRAVVE